MVTFLTFGLCYLLGEFHPKGCAAFTKQRHFSWQFPSHGLLQLPTLAVQAPCSCRNINITAQELRGSTGAAPCTINCSGLPLGSAETAV